jgi:hypothetical protein
MWAAHPVLNLSNNLLAAPEAGTRDGQNFNAVMVVVFYLGLFGIIHHAVSPSNRSSRWVSGKLLILGIVMALGFATLLAG